MHYLFIIDPISSLKAYKDSSVAMMRELAKRGDKISIAYPENIYTLQSIVMARTKEIQIVANANLHSPDWWKSISHRDSALHEFDAILMRKDPPFDINYLYTTHLLDQAQAQGAQVFNQGQAIRNHPEKLSILEFPHLTPTTLVSANSEVLKKFHDDHRDIIAKPLDGMGGSGIFRLMPNDPNRSSVFELLTHNGTQAIMVQTYLPEIAQGDKRVLLINGKPIPFCLARIPSAGETRGNLASGGRGVAQELSASDLAIANQLGPILADRGLMLVGLDIIGDKVTEINVTSPTCFVEIFEQTGFNVAEQLINAIEQTVHD